jgi:hypothetical protein
MCWYGAGIGTLLTEWTSVVPDGVANSEVLEFVLTSQQRPLLPSCGEIQTRRRKNVVQAKSFSAMLEQAIRKYQNRVIQAAQ